MTQLVAARLLGPDDFGVVRVVEAALGILLIPAGIGMSSAVVRYTAVAGDEVARQRVLAASLRLGLVGAAAVTLATIFCARRLPLGSAAMGYLTGLAVVIAFTNASRTVLNYFQGRKEFGRAARWSVVTATLGMASVVVGTALAGLKGWAIARSGTEVLSAAALLWLVRGALSPVPGRSIEGLLRFGAFMAASLALDRVASTADVLILDAVLRSPRLVGQYGAAALVVSAASLLPAAVVAMLIPRFAERVRDPREALSFARAIFAPFVAVVLLSGVLLAAMGPTVLWFGLGREYDLSGRLLVALVPAFVLSAVLSYGGALLQAFDRGDLAVVQSGVGAIVGVALNLALIPILGVWGSVVALIAAHAIRLVLMAFFLARIFRNRHNNEQHDR